MHAGSMVHAFKVSLFNPKQVLSAASDAVPPDIARGYERGKCISASALRRVENSSHTWLNIQPALYRIFKEFALKTENRKRPSDYLQDIPIVYTAAEDRWVPLSATAFGTVVSSAPFVYRFLRFCGVAFAQRVSCRRADRSWCTWTSSRKALC